MLIQVNMSKGETYINVDLENVAKVVVSHNGEAGYAYQRGATNMLELKDGTTYIISSTAEAQRVVDAMRKIDDERYR